MYDVSRFNDGVVKPIDCVMPGYFGGNEVLFVAQNPGVLKEYVEADMFYKNAYILRDYNEMDKTYVDALRSQHGSLGVFINDVYGLDWSNISITNILKCPFMSNKIPAGVSEIDIVILEQQVEYLRPQLIVGLGTYAKTAIGEINVHGARVMLLPHPSYLMRKGTYSSVVPEIRKLIHLHQHETTKRI